MNCGHNRLFDPNSPSDDFDHRGDAIGGATGAGDDMSIPIDRVNPVNHGNDIVAFGRR